MEGIMKNQHEIEYLRSLSSTLNQMRQDKVLTDLQVICDSDIFHVHSAIMSASSSYFRKLLSTRNKPSTISLTKIHPKTFSYVVNFIYTGTIQEPLDFEKLARLIESCKWLNIPDLFQHVGSIAGEFISYANYLTLWNLADDYHIHSLRREVEDFVASNYMKLIMKDTFLELAAIRLKRIFCNKNFPEIRQDVVLDSLSNWAQQKTDRQLQLPVLMKILRTGKQKNKQKTLRNRIDNKRRDSKDLRSPNSESLCFKDSLNGLNHRPASFSESLATTENRSTKIRKKTCDLHQALTEENILIPDSSIKHRFINSNSINKDKSCESKQTYRLESSTSTLYENSVVDEISIRSEPIICRCPPTKKAESIHSCQMNLFGRKLDSNSVIENSRRLCKGPRNRKDGAAHSKNPLYFRNGANSEWMNHLQEIWNCSSSSTSQISSDASTVADTDMISVFTSEGIGDLHKRNLKLKSNRSISSVTNSEYSEPSSAAEELRHLFSHQSISENEKSETSAASSDLLFRIMNTMQNAWKANDTIVNQLVEEMKMQKDVILELSQENKKLLGVIFGYKGSSIEKMKTSTLVNLKILHREKRFKGLKCTQSCDFNYPTVISKSFPSINKIALKKTQSMKNNIVSEISCSMNLSDTDVEENQRKPISNEKVVNKNRIFKNSIQKGSAKMKHSKGRYNIIGCRNLDTGPSKCTLRAATNIFEIYIGRCQPGTTEKDLATYLLECGIKIIECEKLSRENKSLPSTSFRVKVQAESFESLFKAEKWPKGIVVHPFYRKGAAGVSSAKEITMNDDKTPKPFNP